jgi:hypothetical protein
VDIIVPRSFFRQLRRFEGGALCRSVGGEQQPSGMSMPST